MKLRGSSDRKYCTSFWKWIIKYAQNVKLGELLSFEILYRTIAYNRIARAERYLSRIFRETGQREFKKKKKEKIQRERESVKFLEKSVTSNQRQNHGSSGRSEFIFLTAQSAIVIAQQFHNRATFLLISSRNPLVIVTSVNYTAL